MINNHMLRIGALFLLTVLSYGFYNAYLPITDPVESNYVLSAITMLNITHGYPHDMTKSGMINRPSPIGLYDKL